MAEDGLICLFVRWPTRPVTGHRYRRCAGNEYLQYIFDELKVLSIETFPPLKSPRHVRLPLSGQPDRHPRKLGLNQLCEGIDVCLHVGTHATSMMSATGNKDPFLEAQASVLSVPFSPHANAWTVTSFQH